MTALRMVVTTFLLGKLAVLLANLGWFPVLRHGTAVQPDDRVSMLVPMRDEAGRLAAYLPSLAAQEGVAELLVLDDCSRDGSAELARRLLAGWPHARVVDGEPVPAGWVGKSWACHQLAQQATGSLLIFCDADVLLAPGAIGAVVHQLRRQRADVFSVFPRQLTGSLGERLIAPLVDDVLLCFLPFGLLSADVPSAATASGALLAFTRDGYRRLGGFAAVRGEIVEDVALARLARARGLRLGLALGGPLIGTRMYSGYAEVVRGFGRGLLPVFRGSRPALLAAGGWHLLAYTLPVLLTVSKPRWRLPLLLGLLERALVQLKANPGQAWQAVLTPLCPVAFLPVLAQSLRSRQAWKGRSYPGGGR